MIAAFGVGTVLGIGALSSRLEGGREAVSPSLGLAGTAQAGGPGPEVRVAALRIQRCIIQWKLVGASQGWSKLVGSGDLLLFQTPPPLPQHSHAHPSHALTCTHRNTNVPPHSVNITGIGHFPNRVRSIFLFSWHAGVPCGVPGLLLAAPLPHPWPLQLWRWSR